MLKDFDDVRILNIYNKRGKVNLGAMICYDREFPESARILMIKGAEIVLVPNACLMTDIRLAQLKVRAYGELISNNVQEIFVRKDARR